MSNEPARRGVVQVVAHPPERGRRSPVVLNCGCSCCCCCLFVPGAFAGAVLGGTALVAGRAAPAVPETVAVRGRAVALFWVSALVTAFLLWLCLIPVFLEDEGLLAGGGVALLVVFVAAPLVLLAACVPAAGQIGFAGSWRAGRGVGLATIARIGVFTLVGAVVGTAVMIGGLTVFQFLSVL